MIKLPVKDRDTIPWMSRREIPAIKAALSAWRQKRKCPGWSRWTEIVVKEIVDPSVTAMYNADCVAAYLEELAAIDERLRKEAKDGK